MPAQPPDADPADTFPAHSDDPADTLPAHSDDPAEVGGAERVLPPWIAAHIGEGSDKPAGAILRAAAELMAERSPSSVSLREVAARAGVNYGLIHRHYRTKDRLLVALFQEFVLYGGEFIRSSETIHEAIDGTFTADSGGWARIFSWVALDGVPPEQTFRDRSIMAAFQDLIDREWEAGGPAPEHRPRFDPRVVSSFVMLMISVWDFYAPYMRQVDGWTDRDMADARTEVLELMQLLVHAARPAGPGQSCVPPDPEADV